MSLPALGGDLSWRISYASNAVTLSVVSPPTMSGFAKLLDGKFQFTLTGPPGSGYEILGSTDLVHWVTVESNANFLGSLIFTDTNANSFVRRFYRARILE